MAFPCVNKVEIGGRCVCTDYPIANLSSEGQDRQIYIARVDPNIRYRPPPGDFREPEVPIICVSTVSPLDAEECADNATVPPITRDVTTGDPGVPDTPPTTTGDPNIPDPNTPGIPHDEDFGFWNTQSNCIAFCPDHSSSATAIIPAHTVNGQTQAEADMLASNACIALARNNLVCFTPPPEGTIVRVCEGSSTTLNCVISGTVASIVITNLPPGMSSNCTGEGICTISGTPTAAGNYTVTVTAITDSGTHSFDFHIYVLGITCPTTNATLGTAYSGYIHGVGGSAPYSFTPLDLGYNLNMDAGGHITGVPVGVFPCPQTINFTATVIDAEGSMCTKDCTLAISELCKCHDWAYSIDNVTSTDLSGDGTANYSIVGNTYNSLGTKGAQGLGDPVNKGQMHLRRRFPAVAGGVNCTIRLTITAEFSNPNVDNFATVELKYTGGAVLQLTTLFNSTGAPVVTVIPGITNASLDLLVDASCGPNAPPSGAESVNLHVTIENVSAP